MVGWCMANLTECLPENVPGRHYVDASCIDCDQCRTMAPAFFSRNADTGLSFVCRQPVTAEEIALVEEIAATCATGSIGNDRT
jgi:ferredoxin